MARLLKDGTLFAIWKTFFEGHCKSKIETIALEYPENRSLIVDYWDIDKADPKLTETLINHSYKALFNAEEALKSIDIAVDKEIALHFRVVNLPDIHKIPIRKIRAYHMGKYTAIEGLVTRATEVRNKLQVAAFQCSKCGAPIKIEQEEDILKEPSECYEDQGGCGRISSFKLLMNLSTFIDSQKIEIQENLEGLRGGAQPERISAYLEDDLVGMLLPGDRVIVNGILHSQQRRKGLHRLTSFNKVMDAYSTERQELAFEEVEVTPEDEEEILKISKDPEIYNKMKQSIAPTIYGMDWVKEGLVLQMFGGVKKQTPDGTHLRPDIHVLLVGDPGTAKSQLLDRISRISPRSISASGRGASAAGLTAAAVRDEFGEGKWTLEAGALVLADMGIACIDEFDKVEPKDRGSIHKAMEQQSIDINKAGINVTLNTRCAVLAAANPKLGRFDEFIPIHEQINMSPALLSRFDLIFPILDKPDKTTDRRISKHILSVHRGSETDVNISKCKNTTYSKEQRDDLMINAVPVFEPEFLRKYVTYARRNIFPVMTDEASGMIEDYYVRNRSIDEDAIPFTARQLEGFVRLAEANARVRLSNEITVEDAKKAISIVKEYLTRVGMDRETGKFDIDIIETGMSHTQQQRMKTILDIIATLCESSESGAAIEDIIPEAEIKGIDSGKTEDAIKHLEQNKQIFKVPKGGYKINV